MPWSVKAMIDIPSPAQLRDDLRQKIGEQEKEIDRLRAAIRKHRDMRGDDRCYLDDAELYAVLPEGDTRPASDSAVTEENCRRFRECRQQGREYVHPWESAARFVESYHDRVYVTAEERHVLELVAADMRKLCLPSETTK